MRRAKEALNMTRNSRLVYSTDQGRLCPDCHQPKSSCRCRQNQSAVTGDNVVRIQRQTKGRKGKGVTLITGLPLNESDLKTLAKKLKKVCGCGGTVKDGVIEIQGSGREKILATLQKEGFQAKLASG
jgi:translation initiation factor 1